MRTHATLVHCYRAMGLSSQSLGSAEKALRLGPQVEDPLELACMHMNVARSLLDQGRHADAITSLRRAEETFASLDWRTGAAWAQLNRGIVHFEKGEPEKAREALLHALEALERVNARANDRAMVLEELARVERESGDAAAALSALDRARALLDEAQVEYSSSNRLEYALAISGIEPDAAERELHAAIALAREGGAAVDAATAARELGRLLASQGRYEEASVALEDAVGAILDNR